MTQLQVVLYSSDSQTQPQTVTVGCFRDLQKIIGGYVTYTKHEQYHLLYDEDGLPKGLPQNPHFPHIVGPVVKTTPAWEEIPY